MSATEAFTSAGTTLEVVAPEGSRTNYALYSRDLTNAAWVKTNATALKNVTGVDGTVNGASRLTATGANGTALQTITLVSGLRVFSIYLKRITGTGAVSICIDGSTYTDVTALLAAAAGGWVRVSLSSTLADPVFGVKLATSGNVVAVDFAQLEATALTSPIATTSAAVTQSNVVMSAAALGVLFLATTGAATEVGEVVDMGDYGRKYNTVTHMPLATRETRKLKGSYNDGAMAMRLARAPGDDGQEILITAVDDDDAYYFAVTLQDGTKQYFSGLVASYTTNIGGSDKITEAAVEIEINSEIFEA